MQKGELEEEILGEKYRHGREEDGKGRRRN